jgi:nucleoside permease NupC
MTRKSINKRLIGLVIGTTVAGVAKMASTEQGQKQIKTRKDKLLDVAQDAVEFIHGGLKEMKKTKDKGEV